MTETFQSGLPRRSFLRATAVGAAGLAAWSVLGERAGRAAAADRGPAARVVPFNTGWLFGGQFVDGAESPLLASSGQVTATFPAHSVTVLRLKTRE